MRTTPRNPGYVPYRPLGALGVDTSSVASQAGAAVAGKAAGAGASAVLTAAGYGSVAGPVGMVVGAVIGLVAGDLLAKNYLNVAQMNAAEANEVGAFNKYKTIMGQAPGRQFGLAAMTAVWKGALHSGYFHINNVKQCFHNGCSTYPGNASLIDISIGGGSVDKNTFPDMLAAWKAGRSAGQVTAAPIAHAATQAVATRSSAPGLIAGKAALAGLGAMVAYQRPSTPQLAPRVIPFASMRRSLPPEMQRFARTSLRGFARSPRLGSLGLSSAALPDAVVFVDQYLVPANSPPSKCSGVPCYWVQPTNAIEHQILYDVADAYLAERSGVNTTPYVASQMNVAASGAVLAPVSTATVVPATVAVTASQSGTPWSPGAGTLPPVPVQTPQLAPTATPLLPSSPPAVAAAAGVATSVNAATSSNLDAALAAQGFTRAGTTSDGYPIYTQAGQAYLYQNGSLFPYGTVAQLAATGNAGTGIATPSTGLDANTVALIQQALQQGMTAQQAADTAAAALSAQGVPVTPTTQAQLLQTAQQPMVAQSGISSSTLLLIGGGALFLMLLSDKKKAA